MKLVSVAEGVGRVVDGRTELLALPFPDVTALLATPGWRKIAAGASVRAVLAPEFSAPVVRPNAFWVVGTNYASKAIAMDRPLPEHPRFFLRSPHSLAGPETDVPLPEAQVDYEGEVAVVIGRPARAVAEEDAWEFIAGITSCNDVTARDLVRAGDVNVAKSFRNFGVLGGVLATSDEYRDRNSIELSTHVNGELRQQARTVELHFSIPQLIARLSLVTELKPGDVIATGSPVGSGQDHGTYLKAGDEVTVTVEGVPPLTNRFTKESV